MKNKAITFLWSYGLTILWSFCLLPSALWAQTKADTIHVIHYNINLEIRDFANKEIRGFTELTIEAKIAPLPKIELHLLGLTVDSVIHNNNKIDFTPKGQELEVNLSFTSVGETKTIRIYYYGKPKQDPTWGGFFFTNDFAYNMGVGMGSYPHSFGRVWYPCVDEFTDKSTYTFKIITDLDKKAICGGMLTGSMPVGDAIRWTWQLTDPIPTYLASVAVGKYMAYIDTVHSISGEVLPIEIYADPATIRKVPASFVQLKTFIHTYEKRWGACRWQRVGYVIVPFGSGAMEHATNIAFPRSYVTGTVTDDNQDLISHELAHSWFGNLITCSSSNNMWINEGFATYGEYLCHEILDPTLQKYKTGVRKLHMDVLKTTHSKDGGYFALDDVPTNKTYGSTSYDKGGLVAYTLRHYMGDSLYFSSITQFLDENQYANVTSEEFFQKLAIIAGMEELNDFYAGWVHQPGFLNFNIDSITRVVGTNKYQVAFKQRLHHANYFADNNKVDVEFVSASGERNLVERINFSGESDIVEIELPFEPVFWAIDPNFKMGDACFDYTHKITKTGTTSWGDAYFKIQVASLSEEPIIRVEYNPFPPTPPKNVHPDIIKISEKRFWRVGFLQYNTIQAQYSFTYNSANEGELLKGYTKDNLVLLHRRDAAHDWQIISTTVSGTIQQGTLTTNFLLPGEYTFGISENVNVQELENNIEVYPNPTTGELKVTSYKLRVTNIEVFDVLGRKQNFGYARLPKAEGEVVFDISALPNGTYFLRIETENGVIYKQIIKQ